VEEKILFSLKFFHISVNFKAGVVENSKL